MDFWRYNLRSMQHLQRLDRGVEGAEGHVADERAGERRVLRDHAAAVQLRARGCPPVRSLRRRLLDRQ